MNRVLVTGASGFIGHCCVSALRESGYEVHAVSTRQRESGAVQWHCADLLDAAQAGRLFCGVRPSHLLHLAWYTTPSLFWSADENLDWAGAGLNILRRFRENGGQRAVFAGTCAEYRPGQEICSEHDSPLAPDTLYGASKHALHGIVESYARKTGLSAAWARLFFLYGPREHPARMVPSVIRALTRGAAVVCSHGRQIRDYLYVEDAAAALVALLGHTAEGPVNIASGIRTSVREIMLAIAARTGGEELLQFGAKALGAHEPPVILADVSRLCGEVGWKPQYDLATGLDRTIAWWRGNQTA